MSLRDDIPALVEYAEKYKPLIWHNRRLFDIYEGNLRPYVEESLSKQLSINSFEQVKARIAPLNILTKLVDKLSKIYQQSPVRYVVSPDESDAPESDSQLLAWYESILRPNSRFNISNEFFNLFKNNLIQPYIHNGKPKLRIIPSDRFLPYSDDSVDPTTPTHMILIMDEHEKLLTEKESKTVTVYHAYTDEEFLIFDSDGDIDKKSMTAIGNPDGINPYGKMPFTYVNKSSNLLIPKPDTDTLAMTILLPVLLSDLNYAVMYQSFSILWTLNAKLPDEFKMAPNAVWPLQSLSDENKAEIGQIKPQVDITETLGLIQAELAFWLNTKGIRPGSVGELQAESFSSGISKMIDEMDTSEIRQAQTETYSEIETEFWSLLFNYIHPVWVKNGLVDNRTLFSSDSAVKVNFSEQIPILKRGDVVRDLKDEIAAGFNTRRRAIKELRPKMSKAEVDKLMAEIDEERGYAEQQPLQEVSTDAGQTTEI